MSLSISNTTMEVASCIVLLLVVMRSLSISNGRQGGKRTLEILVMLHVEVGANQQHHEFRPRASDYQNGENYAR